MTARREAARALLSARERPHYEVQPLHLRLRRGEDGGQRPSNAALSDYQLYLAMIEPQKKLKFYEKSTMFLLSVCATYATQTLDSASGESKGENNPHVQSTEWMRSVLSRFEDWSSSHWVDFLIERDEQRDKVRSLILSIPENMLDMWKSTRKSVIGDEDPKEKFVDILDANLSESIGDLPHRLASDGDVQAILKLREGNAQKVIDLLDEVSIETTPDNLLHRNCERTLRRLCGRAGLLPNSTSLSESDIERKSTVPSCGGGFADVYEGVYLGNAVALKALRVYGKDNIRKVQKSFCKEAVFWRRLVHPNIVSFLGVVNSESLPLCMVSIWMQNGNMAKFLEKNPHSNRLELLIDAARGLLYLHRLGIVHSDVKSANVLIDDKLHACLSDFGLAAVTHDARTASMITTSTTMHGSIRWMAPELLHPTQTGREHGRATAETDVYAFAMLMLETFTGNMPFEHQHRDATVVIDVTLGIRPPRPGVEVTSRGLSDAVWSLVEESWQADWRKRPRVPAILAALEEASRIYVPNALLLSHPSSTELQPTIAGRDDSDYESDSDDGRFFNRDLTRPDFDYGNGIEMVPIPHAQLTVAVGEDNSVSRSLEVSLPCTFEAGSVSLDMSSSSNSVESSSQWSSSFNDMDWDMDSSSTF